MRPQVGLTVLGRPGFGRQHEVRHIIAARDEARPHVSATDTEKAANVPGLQLADLCARPIGIKILRPDAKNRAFDESVSLLMQAQDAAMLASGPIITL